jgi:hypothetical protein
MPDGHPPNLPRHEPERIDLGAIKTDLEFGSNRRSAPNDQQQALRPLYVMVGSAGRVIAWIELFWRH